MQKIMTIEYPVDDHAVLMSWDEGFQITTYLESETSLVLQANREGLISLARLFLSLAHYQGGTHVHLDEYNGILDGKSVGLVICKDGD